MYNNVTDFNLEDFELIAIESIIDEGKVVKTMDIEVNDKHYFYVSNPNNKTQELIVSHNTAEIAFGAHTDESYLDLKNYEKNPDRAEYGWTSNNTVFCDLGMNYESVAKRTQINGEPGYAWLSNMQDYSRMNNGKDYKDHRVKGGNPCLEQSLEHMELCCLVETFPNNHESLEDYKRTLKCAYLYAKTVTLGKTHWPETNRVLLRNRRIGCSMSGLAQFVTYRGLDTLKQWCENGYEYLEQLDKHYSDWLAIPLSIKKSSIKPSGSVSLLAGATPGMHYPESRFYIRRMRLGVHSELVKPLKKAGYNLEPSVTDPDNTVIVEIPIDVGQGIRTTKDLSIWEQTAFAAFLQKYWSDNQVSCTVTFDPKTEGNQIQHVLNFYQYQLKGISFLPRAEKGSYPQMPYEEITEEVYKEKIKTLKPVDFDNISKEEADIDVFCDGEKCVIDAARQMKK